MFTLSLSIENQFPCNIITNSGSQDIAYKDTWRTLLARNNSTFE